MNRECTVMYRCKHKILGNWTGFCRPKYGNVFLYDVRKEMSYQLHITINWWNVHLFYVAFAIILKLSR